MIVSIRMCPTRAKARVFVDSRYVTNGCRKPGIFLQKARAKPWNKLLAVGGHFSSELLGRLIKWEWWAFDDCTIFSMTLKRWQVISPDSWNLVRFLTLGKIWQDGSNCQDIIDLLPRVSMFTHLTSFRIVFEVEEPFSGYIDRYFDHDADLDETHPELFKTIEAVRLPGTWTYVGFLKNSKVSQYLGSVMSGNTTPVIRQPNVIPYWRRDPELPWAGNWF